MNKTKKKGFTLIEVLVALSFFTLAILASFALAMSNLRIAQENYDRVLASNLAREGIELVRNIRDSNWLKIDANYDCDDDISGIQLCYWNEGLIEGDYIINYDSSELIDLDNNSDLNIDNGLYTHNNNGEGTAFSRSIRLDDIIEEANKIGIKVISKVSWARHGKSFEEQAITNIYNWKR